VAEEEKFINLALAKAGFKGPLNLVNAKISCKLNRQHPNLVGI
jgi:hypothetical protein